MINRQKWMTIHYTQPRMNEIHIRSHTFGVERRGRKNRARKKIHFECMCEWVKQQQRLPARARGKNSVERMYYAILYSDETNEKPVAILNANPKCIKKSMKHERVCIYMYLYTHWRAHARILVCLLVSSFAMLVPIPHHTNARNVFVHIIRILHTEWSMFSI